MSFSAGFSQVEKFQNIRYLNYERRRIGDKSTKWKYIYTTQKSVESVARISLYNKLQTPADSERIGRSSYNFRRYFLHDHHQCCEKQVVLNDTTLIVQKPLFWPQITKLRLFDVFTISLVPMCKISLALMQYYLIYHILYSHTNTKNGKFSKVVTVGKSILYPKSQIEFVFLLSQNFEKNANFEIF